MTSTPPRCGTAAPEGSPRPSPRWLYALTGHGQAAVDGIEFDSRHGDQLRMWALSTNAPPTTTSAHTSTSSTTPPSTPRIPQLARALTLLGLEWTPA